MRDLMTNLPKRMLGRTGETCTALSMGCGFPIGYAGFGRSVETVQRAVSLGINYFDNSPLYRAGGSQAIVGEALPGRKTPHLLATKVGHFKEAKFFRSVEAMRVQLREN